MLNRNYKVMKIIRARTGYVAIDAQQKMDPTWNIMLVLQDAFLKYWHIAIFHDNNAGLPHHGETSIKSKMITRPVLRQCLGAPNDFNAYLGKHTENKLANKWFNYDVL